MKKIVNQVLLAALAFMYVLPVGMAYSDDLGLTDEITFTLVDASTDQDLSTLVDEATINLARTGQELNVRADIGVPVDHVRFEVDGTDFSTEKKIPYALAGDDAGNYTSWTPEVGHYTLQATAYDATDNEVASKIIYFTVVDNATDAGSFTKTAKQNESFQPLGHKWREVIWGYDKNPCNNYAYRDAYFPDIGNEDREVVSAKLYVNAHYGFGPMPPYCPPGEVCDEEDDERASLLSTCDGSKFHKFIYGGEILPNNKWKEFDLPLRYFECGKEDRSYRARLPYHKTNVFNQHAQLAGLRLEIEFGDICEKPEPEDPNEPAEPEVPDIHDERPLGKSESWWDPAAKLLETVPTDNYDAFSGDYNGDGLDDIALFVDYGNTTSRIHVLLSNGEEFQPNGDNVWWSNEAFDAKTVKGKITSGDFNNDGFDDIAMIYDYHDGSFEVADLLISTGESFKRHFKFDVWRKPSIAYIQTGKPVTGDYDGDGIDDIAIFHDNGNSETFFQVLRLNRSTIEGGSTWLRYPNDLAEMGKRIVTGDFNNDGYDDIAMMYCSDDITRAYVFLSTGNGFQLPSNQGWWETGDFHRDRVQGFVAGDFDGDGYDDVSINEIDIKSTHQGDMHKYVRTHVLFSSGSAFKPIQNSHVHSIEHYGSSMGISFQDRFTSGKYNNDGVDNISHLNLKIRRDLNKKYFRIPVLFYEK